jgi:excisionase family DNA binding protein
MKPDTINSHRPAGEVLLYTTKEACSVLKISRSHLWKLEKAGKIRPVAGMGPKSKRYAADELRLFVNRRAC